jgi:outer membrane protein OmpA-like peptidoglycan-associated protein
MAQPFLKVAGGAAAALLFGGLICSPVAAQDVPANEIIKALQPPPVTRSLSGGDQPGVSDADRTFVDDIRHRTRSLTVDERDHVATIAKDRPKIDLEINFDFNSADVRSKAQPQVNELGKALSSPQLAGSVFVLAGHTDAKGSDEYNQKLSERRAEAVKAYLVAKLKIPADRLSTAGYGKRDLKNPADPFAAENRRVQVLNVGTAEAKR